MSAHLDDSENPAVPPSSSSNSLRCQLIHHTYRRRRFRNFTQSPNSNSQQVNSSSSNSLRCQFIHHTYRRRRFRNFTQSPNSNSQQFVSSKRSPNIEHNSCDQAGFHDLENHETSNGPNNSILSQSRNSVFESFFKMLNVGGVGQCMKAAFKYHGMQSCIEKECTSNANCLLSHGFVPSAVFKNTDGNIIGESDGLMSTNCCTNTELCQRAFSDIMVSGEFASLCKLLSENFHGIKVERLFDCSFIDRRVNEGAYEHMPVLFPSDIHQFWKRLESVGAEIVSFSRTLSDRSKDCCIQSGFLRQDTSGCGKLQGVEHSQFSSERFASHETDNQQDVEVGEKSDGNEFFICGLCQEMYHFSCIQPGLKEISSRNGYCSKCIIKNTGLLHENCVVCKKLQYPRVSTNVDCEKRIVTTEETSTDQEESSNSDMEEQMCKICSIEIESNESYHVCGHECCQGRFYHERCLTIQQRESHTSCWYCPSCLCRVCFINKDDDKIVLCDGCDHGYHIHCLNPPLSSIPRGKWFCAACKPGMSEIARVRKSYMSGFTLKRTNSEASKEADGQSRKKQNTTDCGIPIKENGTDILSTTANTLNKE